MKQVVDLKSIFLFYIFKMPVENRVCDKIINRCCCCCFFCCFYRHFCSELCIHVVFVFKKVFSFKQRQIKYNLPNLSGTMTPVALSTHVPLFLCTVSAADTVTTARATPDTSVCSTSMTPIPATLITSATRLEQLKIQINLNI